MRITRTGIVITTVILAAILAATMWRFMATERAHPDASVSTAKADRTVVYWYDPMHPEHHFDAPGKSPFMDMQLVPRYDDATPDETRVQISSQMVQNLGMRTAPVVRGSLPQGVDVSGRIEADQRSVQKILVRAEGWVEVLHVRAEGDPVQRGEVLAEVYSPALETAQREFVLALESGEPALVAAARGRLEALGFAKQDIAELERTKHANRRVSVRAPLHGYVMALLTREGAAVAPDAPLFELVGHDPLWVIVELPESLAAAIAVGDAAKVRTASFPGRTFDGAIDYLYPELDSSTRTRRARIVLDNHDDALHPGMFVDVALSEAAAGDHLLVPSEAVIRTGKRDVVIVAEAGGAYRPAQVVVGLERDGQTVILSGLDEGDRVVTSGQFLIDSEASLRGAFNRMQEDGGAPSPPAGGAAP